MPKYDHVSDRTLEKYMAQIEAEQKKRKQERGGQDYSEFITLHLDPGCNIQTVYVGPVPTGFQDSDTLSKVGAYGYKLRCVKHKSKSSLWADMTWVEGAINESKK